MATNKKPYTRHKLTGHMLKRLAQLAAGLPPNYGTSMAALVERGLVDRSDNGRHTLTDEGREALAAARAEGW